MNHSIDISPEVAEALRRLLHNVTISRFLVLLLVMGIISKSAEYQARLKMGR